VIPTYNEAANLPAVFEALPDSIWELLIVDGWSTDGTVEVAKALRPDVRIVTQTRRGKGNALACGFNNARGDVVVMLDADLSTDPREIPRYVDVLLDGADYAKGSRFASGGTSHDITPVRKLGNVFLNTTVNVLYRTRYSDLCYGYNAFWRDVLPVLAWTAASRHSTCAGATGSRSRPSSTSAQPRPGCASSRCPASSSRACTGRAS
jgi:glycosyltransferase involved in cell wall biosynthesis